MQGTLYSLHISIGVTLLFFLVARVVVRVAFDVPALPDHIQHWHKSSAHLAHAPYELPAGPMVAVMALRPFRTCGRFGASNRSRIDA